MKKCVNCAKESEGNFCVFCGEKLIEEEKNEEILKQTLNEIIKENEKTDNSYKETAKKYSNNNKIYIYISIISIIIIVAMGIYIAYDKANVSDEISSLKSQISKLKKEKSDLQDENWDYLMENVDYKDKADFLDENIVFVLDGYGNYYYTYDQVQQVTQGNEFTYWAYNKEAAISHGYKAWK